MTPPKKKAGFTLLEVVVSAAILGILATMVVLSVEGSSRTSGDANRIDGAASVLAKLRDAAVRYNLGARGDTSFTWKISGPLVVAKGTNPGRLSQLTNPITGQLNSCGLAFTSAEYGRWLRNFYSSPISSSTPYHIADGFDANDLLQRFDTLGNPLAFSSTNITSPGTLAIVIPGVSLSDAQELSDRMEGDRTGGLNSVVRFTPSGDAPVTLYYHMAIHGC